MHPHQQKILKMEMLNWHIRDSQYPNHSHPIKILKSHHPSHIDDTVYTEDDIVKVSQAEPILSKPNYQRTLLKNIPIQHPMALARQEKKSRTFLWYT